MKALTKQGPKRRRATRRQTSAVSRQGWHQAVVTNFKREREARINSIIWKEQTP